MKKPLMRINLTDQIVNLLIDRALQPQEASITLEVLTEEMSVSRTPVRDALTRLEMVGLYEVEAYYGVHTVFAGAEDIRQRAMILAAGIEAGASKGDRLVEVALTRDVGGTWARHAWAILEAWPEHAQKWDLDLTQHVGELDALWDRASSAICSGESHVAAKALRAWGTLATQAVHTHELAVS